MANMSKLKRRGTLGAPPSVEEASSNLEQPETAPAPAAEVESKPVSIKAEKPATKKIKTPAATSAPTPKQEEPPIIDGRTLRRKGRTVQFNARVTPEFHQRMFRLVAAEDRPAVDILEDMLALYEAQANA
jgi:hypothetical protein